VDRSVDSRLLKTSQSVEIDRISPALSVWHRYDSEVKAELYATALRFDDGVIFIDPFATAANSLAEITEGDGVGGVIVSNANHARACVEFAEKFSAPIYAHHETVATLNFSRVTEIGDDSIIAEQLDVVSIEGAAPGEIALHSKLDGGAVIVGDALINFGEHGFTFLPAKYRGNAKLMRKSLRKLLDYQFERLLFAHGMPIVTGARQRLESLLVQS
jgi:glyoxylase-like metal-dependent hydrolase (beta-lactamase superfamily II)